MQLRKVFARSQRFHLRRHRMRFLSGLQAFLGNGGRGGIRTHGGLPHARFRVECLKPDSATLPSKPTKTPNTERPTFNAECNPDCPRRYAIPIERREGRRDKKPALRIWGGLCERLFGSGFEGKKNVTIFILIGLRNALHIGLPPGSKRYGFCCSPELTGIHRLLASLFASINKLLTLTPLPNHDSTQTRYHGSCVEQVFKTRGSTQKRTRETEKFHAPFRARFQ